MQFSFRMKSLTYTLVGLSLAIIPGAQGLAQIPAITAYISTLDMGQQMEQRTIAKWKRAGKVGKNTIDVDDSRRYQEMLGIGNSLEHASLYNLSLLEPADRKEALTKILDPGKGIGMNIMRICMGTPDFTSEDWYTYDDMPPGETDVELANFSIEKDMAYVVPVLKEALAINPDLLLFAAPWSPPGWMTSTDNWIGGHLLPEYYTVYANYFVKFIQAYAEAGIPIHAVTIQNEPGVNRDIDDPTWHYPSCRWTGEQERDFIAGHLGPAITEAGLETKILCYDHNYNLEPHDDNPGLPYPRTILSDSAASSYVEGTGFHLYAGQPKNMTVFHKEFPDKSIYFTEGSVFALRGARTLVDILRNWSRSYNAWVTILNENRKPNNGPFDASETMLTYNSTDRSVKYNFDYFMYGHFAKFIQRGAVRIGSEGSLAGVHHVAFHNPDGSIVIIVANGARNKARFTIQWQEKKFKGSLPPESIATYVWEAGK